MHTGVEQRKACKEVQNKEINANRGSEGAQVQVIERHAYRNGMHMGVFGLNCSEEER